MHGRACMRVVAAACIATSNKLGNTLRPSVGLEA